MSEVVVVGAGPIGLMLASELALGGLRPVVLEKRAEAGDLPKANGIVGMATRLLDYRGLLSRLTASSPFHGLMPGFPFGSVPLRFAELTDNPVTAVMIQQPQLEAALAGRAVELGAEIRRGHAVDDLRQDPAGCTVDVVGPEGPYALHPRYVVGCDGGRSRVRDLAGIGFPGDTDEEVLRLGHFTADADLFDTPAGLRPGWNRTPRGRILVTSLRPGVQVVGVRDADPATGPMSLDELRAAIRRVLGRDMDLGEPIWLSRTVPQARIAEKYRAGRVFLAGDAAHLFPAGGSLLNVGLMDAANLGWKLAGAVHGWAPDGLLDTYESERRPVGERALSQTRAQAVLDRMNDADGAAIRQVFGELVAYQEPLRHMADLVDGSDVRYDIPGDDPRVGRFVDTRVDLSTGEPLLHNDILVRPDGYVAWAGDGPVEDALVRWFGLPGRRLLGQRR